MRDFILLRPLSQTRVKYSVTLESVKSNTLRPKRRPGLDRSISINDTYAGAKLFILHVLCVRSKMNKT